MYLWKRANEYPVKLAFNNQERVENFAGRVGSRIEADSLSPTNLFKILFLKENGFTKENVLVMFIPNTYMNSTGIQQQINSVIRWSRNTVISGIKNVLQKQTAGVNSVEATTR
jgi:UPF0755 protein